MRRPGRGIGLGLGLAGLLAGAWLAGFLWFVRAAFEVPATAARADGIVVLTGGADRIASGLRLLQQGRGRLLLISGVGGAADLASLARDSFVDVRPLAWRITIGRSATSTIGNAEETTAWARAHDLHTLIIVTAGYHMQRALTEIGRASPGLSLIPAPVLPAALRGPGGFSAIRLLAHEYTKWLISEVGLTRLEAG